MSRVGATRTAQVPSAAAPQRRQGFLRTYLTPKQAIPAQARLALAVGSFVFIVGVWSGLAALVQNPLFVPSPYQVVTIRWLGVFFQLVLIVMDIAHRVPAEMLNVAYTLGASRWTVFYKVFLPATFPEVVDALRITMGWAWTYLIVAELVAAEHGIGSFILIAERYLRADRIIAAIITIGILGLITDT